DRGGEALREGLSVTPEPPLAGTDGHLVDAADVPVIGVELPVAASGGVAADHADAVRRLRHLHGGALDTYTAAAASGPLEGRASLARPRLAAGRCRRHRPLAHQHLQLLQGLLRGRLIHAVSFPIPDNPRMNEDREQATARQIIDDGLYM